MQMGEIEYKITVVIAFDNIIVLITKASVNIVSQIIKMTTIIIFVIIIFLILTKP